MKTIQPPSSSFPASRSISRARALPTAFPLAGTGDGLLDVAGALSHTIGGKLAARRLRGPLPVGSPAEVLAKARQALGPALLLEHGLGPESAIQQVAGLLLEHGINLTHPHAAAHLQPPPLAVAVAADVLVSAENGSQDTYDSGPAGIAIERWVIETLTKFAGLGERAAGVFTPGGSLSNLMALLLARDAAAAKLGTNARSHGVAGLPRPVVFCSELAHFSVHRACATLGLGEAAVVPVPTDEHHRMRADALTTMLRGLGPGETPIAIVATAGSTDFGSVDPLPELAAIARRYGIWFHVDAAYGFGALFSERLAEKMAGLELAHSVTVDLHKIGWQPAAASILLVRDADAFVPLERSVDYLNPPDDAQAGYDGLLGRSLQTTRRADAVKVAATLLAYGRSGLGAMVDACHELARYAEARIAAHPELELVAGASLTTVVFRYRGGAPAWALDDVNAGLRRALLSSGIALIGRTSARIGGRAAHPGGGHRPSTCLKFTLLNPNTTPADLDDLLEAIVRCGRAQEQHLETPHLEARAGEMGDAS